MATAGHSNVIKLLEASQRLAELESSTSKPESESDGVNPAKKVEQADAKPTTSPSETETSTTSQVDAKRESAERAQDAIGRSDADTKASSGDEGGDEGGRGSDSAASDERCGIRSKTSSDYSSGNTSGGNTSGNSSGSDSVTSKSPTNSGDEEGSSKNKCSVASGGGAEGAAALEALRGENVVAVDSSADDEDGIAVVRTTLPEAEHNPTPFPVDFSASCPWHKSYVRTRHRNLRCFPCCSTTHKESSFCGVSISVRISGITNPNDYLILGSLRRLNDPLLLSVGAVAPEVIPEAFRSNRIIVGQVGASSHSTTPTTGSDMYDFVPPRRWKYNCRLAKHTARQSHLFTIYICDKAKRVCRQVSDGPTFQIKSAWRQNSGTVPRPSYEAIPALYSTGPNVITSKPMTAIPSNQQQPTGTDESRVSRKRGLPQAIHVPSSAPLMLNTQQQQQQPQLRQQQHQHMGTPFGNMGGPMSVQSAVNFGNSGECGGAINMMGGGGTTMLALNQQQVTYVGGFPPNGGMPNGGMGAASMGMVSTSTSLPVFVNSGGSCPPSSQQQQQQGSSTFASSSCSTTATSTYSSPSYSSSTSTMVTTKAPASTGETQPQQNLSVAAAAPPQQTLYIQDQRSQQTQYLIQPEMQQQQQPYLQQVYSLQQHQQMIGAPQQVPQQMMMGHPHPQQQQLGNTFGHNNNMVQFAPQQPMPHMLVQQTMPNHNPGMHMQQPNCPTYVMPNGAGMLQQQQPQQHQQLIGGGYMPSDQHARHGFTGFVHTTNNFNNGNGMVPLAPQQPFNQQQVVYMMPAPQPQAAPVQANTSVHDSIKRQRV